MICPVSSRGEARKSPFVTEGTSEVGVNSDGFEHSRAIQNVSYKLVAREERSGEKLRDFFVDDGISANVRWVELPKNLLSITQSGVQLSHLAS